MNQIEEKKFVMDQERERLNSILKNISDPDVVNAYKDMSDLLDLIENKIRWDKFAQALTAFISLSTSNINELDLLLHHCIKIGTGNVKEMWEDAIIGNA